jgi:RNA polymerase primary sigma factor
MKPIFLDKTISERTEITIRYQNDIRKTSPMTPDEEYAAFELLKRGDTKIKEQIILSNLRFVISCAKKYEGCGISIDDLVNEGNIGLITAVERFDHTKGFKFISYAVAWIRQSILLAISENSRVIYLPATITSKLTKVKDEINKMEMKYGYVDMNEVMENTNLSRDIMTISNLSQTVSTETVMSDDDEITLGDTLKSDDSIDDNFTTEYVMKLMSVLTNEEVDVIKRVYGFPPYLMAQSVECIADNYKSVSYVNTLYRRAITKLKNVMKKEYA